MAEAGKKAMETIVETMEAFEVDEINHPLLQPRVLKRLFGYLSISELKISRRVCLSWRDWATPYLQNLSIVRLKGTCDLCKSEWNVKKKLPHDHRETISLYRFVTQLHTLTPGERERLFFRNFLLENINLYLIGRLNTDCTAYFLRLAKFFGSKVFQLHLQNVQLCPSDSLKTLMAMFRNVEVVTVDKVQVWQDPLFPSDESSRVLPPAANMLLTSLSFLGDCTFELPLDWKGTLQQCPELQEVQLEEVRISQVNNFVAALSIFTPQQLERLRVRKLTLVPRNDPLEELLESGVEDATSNDLTLSLNKIQWASALTSILQSVPILELKLRLPYSDDSYDVIQALQGVNSSLGSLSLRRASFVSAGESEVFFKPRPWEITEEHWIQLPFVHTLEIAHNLSDSLDEIKHVFPGLEKLSVFIIPTEIRGGKGKPYSTYLHTNLILSMRNASAIKTVRNLEWNVQEARDGSGKRTVVYRSRAIRHIPRIFPNLVSLKLSISAPNELQCIFRQLGTLEELTLLGNSLYRIKDEDMCGDEAKPTSSRSPKSRTKVGGDPTIGQGIRQLKHLTRLSLENNNSHLTDRSIHEGLTTLRNLRSLHISNGNKLTFRGLRMLRKCRYLVYVNVTDVKDEGLRITHMQEGHPEEWEEYIEPDEPLNKTSEQVDINLGHVSKIPMRVRENGVGPKRPRRMITSEEKDRERLPILVAHKPMKPPPGTEKKVEDFVLPPLTQYPMSNTAGGVNDDEHEEGLKELERLWKKRQEKVIKKGGKYEMGDKFSKIGGRRYDYIRTTYKVNGRTYQLVRRTYDDDGEGDQICAKHRAWKEKQRRKQLQADLDALSECVSSDQEDAASDGDSESEYERSIKENDEDDDLEEYCDDDDDGPPVLSQSSGHSSDSDETFEEEGVCSDDSRYEADKEFYDSSPAEEESGNESENSEKEMSEASVDKGFVSESSVGGGTKTKIKKRIRFQEPPIQSFEEPEVESPAESEIPSSQTSAIERFEMPVEPNYKEFQSMRFEMPDEPIYKEFQSVRFEMAERERMEESVLLHYEALKLEQYKVSELKPYEAPELEPYEESELEPYEESEIEHPHESEFGILQESVHGRPQESELERYKESELEQPQETEIGDPQESEIGDAQGSEIGDPQESEIGDPQGSEIGDPQESELDGPQESELGCYQESELEQPQEPEFDDPQESELERYQESELEHPQGSEFGDLGETKLERYQESELAHLQESKYERHKPEFERHEESELDRYEESELKRPQESELDCYQESELDLNESLELQHLKQSDHNPYEAPELQRYEVPMTQLYKVPELTHYDAPKHQRYGTPDLQRYSAPQLKHYSRPELQRYSTPQLRHYNDPEHQLYNATDRQRYGSPTSKYSNIPEFQRYEKPEPHFYEESEFECNEGSNAGGLEESLYERSNDSKNLRFSEPQPGSLEDSPCESFDKSDITLISSPQVKHFEDSQVKVVEESRIQRFEESRSGRYEETTYERLEKSKYDNCEESKYERHEKTKFERFSGSSHERSADSSFEGSSESQQKSGESSQFEGIEESSLQSIPYHARVKFPILQHEPYKYVQRRSAPIKAYQNIDFEPLSRRVQSQCESRRGSGSSLCESNGIYPPDWSNQTKPLPSDLLRRYRFDESVLPLHEFSASNGSHSNSSNSNDSINHISNSNGSINNRSNSNGSVNSRSNSNGSVNSRSNSNGSVNSRSNSNGSINSRRNSKGSINNIGNINGIISSRRNSNGSINSCGGNNTKDSISNRSNSNNSRRSGEANPLYNKEMDKREAQFSPSSVKSHTSNAYDDEERASQHSQMSLNEELSQNGDDYISLDKRSAQKSPPTKSSVSSTRKPSLESGGSRSNSSSSHASQRSSKSVSSMKGQARKKGQTIVMPCLNPQDRHHLESSF